MQELAGMFNNNSAAKPLLDQFWSKTEALNNEEWIISLMDAGDYETENRLADELNGIQDSLAAIWLNEFKDGTFIWLSDRQEELYGNVCFSVTLPDTAVEIYSAPVGKSRYTLYFVPARIPSQNFKLV
jgi:hypothetical protein